MFSSTPGINGVEHPIYDIWLLRCYNSDASKHHILNEDQLKLRDELPQKRPEKIEQNIKLMTVGDDMSSDENPNDESTNISSSENNSDTAQTSSTEETVINIDVVEAPDSDKSATEEITDSEFVAEGEEIIGEPIVINNETVAQDEENQKEKEKEQTENITPEKNQE